MTQYARPDQDIARGSDCDDGMGGDVCWLNQAGGTTNLYASIDETSASDSDYIVVEEGMMGTSDQTAKFRLSDVTDPESSSDHVVYYRAKCMDMTWMGCTALTVTLYDGSTGIATGTASVTTSWADYSFTLNAGQANMIGDYNNLFLWIKHHEGNMQGDGHSVSYAAFACPDASTPTAAPSKANPEAFMMFID